MDDQDSPPGTSRSDAPQLGGLAYSPWLRRGFAFVVDGMICALVAYLIARGVGVHNVVVTTSGAGKDKVSASRVNGEFIIFELVCYLAYAIGFMRSGWHATPLMRVLQMRLAAADGTDPTVRQVLTRAGASLVLTIVALLGFIFLLPALIDYCWPLWDASRQTLHDKVAGTVVVDAQG